MFFGMPVMVECNGMRENAEVAKRLGLDFIEMNMSFPEYTKERIDADELRKIAEDYGIFYTIHADEFLNPFDFNSNVSECYFSVMKDTIEVAKKIGAKIINLHLLKGIYVTLPERVILLTDVYFDEYIEKVRRFVSLCESEIGGSGIKICIENVDSNAFSSSQIKALDDVFMKSPVFFLTLDTGHEFCLEGKDTFVFEKYPDRLMHMHLHDAKGRKPHLALGDGEIDIKSKLSLLTGDTCLIEVKTIEGLEKSVKYLKEKQIVE